MGGIRKKIAIVGGGITGLSAAYYAKKLFAEHHIPVDLTLIEKSEQLGGKIRTRHRDGFVIEQGPDSFMSRKLPIIALTRELGLEDELTATNPKAKTNYILHKGRLHRMPLGLVLGIPTEVAPFIKTGLISPIGKARAAFDLLLPKKKGVKDESLGSFIERRLGKEVLEHITEPLLAGIYAGDTGALSLKATFPQFHELEQKHRSLILGMLSGKKRTRETKGLPEIARNSMFLTYKGGLETLVNRLTEVLQPTKVITSQGVVEIARDEQEYHLRLEQGLEMKADGLIMALPAYQTAELMPDLPALKWLKKIPYVSVANIVLAFNQEDIAFPLDGSGFVVPRGEGRTITACTWTSSKWLHTVPKGKILLRTYVGRAGAQEWVPLTDGQLLAKVRSDLKEIMGITAEPIFHEITRLKQSMPQYPVGHLEQLKKLREELICERPGIFLCGAGYQGVGIPDCIQQGKQAAEQMFKYMKSL
ncbi:MAG TPA: protoporphyrinogen oxidase [Candidatus Udaeobacter sp.]|nr:protoporphyrinogen oxidase [Candidatus Udaeobacter sp.]